MYLLTPAWRMSSFCICRPTTTASWQRSSCHAGPGHAGHRARASRAVHARCPRDFQPRPGGSRCRIARELHDTIGQFLTGLRIRLSALQEMPETPSEVHAGLADLRRVANQIDGELDRLTLELRPPALDDLGLEQGLRSYIQEWMTTSGVAVDLVTHGLEQLHLPTAVETTVYRIAQEALTNVLKHTQATQVSIILEQRSDLLRVIVEDDGQGFDIEAVSRARSGGRQLGLVGMVERATLAGGTLTVESEPGSGTTIYLRIPRNGERQASRIKY